MTALDIVLCALFISICATALYCAFIRYELSKKHKEEVDMLKAKIYTLEERLAYLDGSHKWHMTKYH